MATIETSSAGPMNAGARLLNVIIEPTRTFADIAARPGWLVPMIVVVLVSVGFTFALSSHIGWEQILRHGIETAKQTQNLSAEQREAAVQTQMKFVPIVAPVGAVLAPPVMMLIYAGIFQFIFTTVLGGTVVFKQTLAVVAHSMIPGVISSLANLVVLYMKDPSEFDVNNPSGFNLGFYLDPQSSPAWLVSLGSSLDVFSIWILLLLATGMSVAARKSWKASLAGVAAPWLLYVVLKVGWAAIRG